MGNTHETSNAMLKQKAATWAEEVVSRALPKLQSCYDKGHPDPEVPVVLSKATCEEINVSTDGNESFADYVFGLIFAVASEKLSAHMDGRTVDVYGDKSVPFVPGQAVKVNVKVMPQ